MAIGESAGLLFKIKGDASDAIRAFRDTEAAQTGLTGSTAGLTSGLSSLVGPALLAGAAVTVVATAAVAGARALFDLTKSTAEFGSTIFDASQKTGLGAQTLSALKFAAEQSGSSFEQVTKGITFFQVELGKMSQGSDKAADKMKLLGVTSTDTRTALAQAVKTIYEAGDANERAALAAAAFGKRLGPELIPLILDAKGNLDALEESAKTLGVTITDEAMVAADKFGDDLAALGEQVSGLGRTIGTAFMPFFNDMVSALSDFLTRNQGAFKQWGDNATDVIRGVIITMDRLDVQSRLVTNSSIASWANWSMKMFAYLDPVQYALIRTINKMRELGAASGQLTGFAMGQVSPNLGGGGGGGGGGGRGGGGRADNSAQREADKAAREAERAAAKDLAAQIKIELGNLRQVQEQLSNAFDKIKKDLLGSDVKAVQQALLQFTEQWVDNLLASLNHLDELERQQLDVDASDNERAALKQAQEERRHKIKLQFAAEIKKAGDEAFEDQLKQGEILADLAQRYFEEEMERIEKRREELKLDELPVLSTIPLPGLNPDAPPEAYDPFQAWIESWTRFVNQIYADAPTLKQTIQSIGGIIAGAFQGMASAIGGVVQQWVLYGTTGPAVMRKVLAAALASIAAEAAVRAIWELALGFASLFFNPAEAVAHFTAAALFGSIAVGAALAGRAVAGNAFRQQTATATGATGSNTQGSRASAGAYSGQEPITYEQGINRAAISGDINIKLGLNSDGVIEVLEQNARSNGRVRFLILDTVGNA